MLIVGARGCAKEVLEIFHQLDQLENIGFYDDVNDVENFLYNRFVILKNEDEVKAFFNQSGSDFTIGIGNPHLRYKLYKKFTDLGGIFRSAISPYSKIGSFGTIIEEGCNIMTGTIITNDVKIGKGVLINLNCTVSHDSIIKDFVELSPGVRITGNCTIEKFSSIGTNSTILPNINIGKNVIVGAGSVVNKDIPDNSLVVGVPARIVKNLEPLQEYQ